VEVYKDILFMKVVYVCRATGPISSQSTVEPLSPLTSRHGRSLVSVHGGGAKQRMIQFMGGLNKG